MTNTVAILIDGGHLRVMAKKAGKKYDPDFIEKFAAQCITHSQPHNEILQRVLYYDCPLFAGTVRLPVTNQEKKYEPSAVWLDDLASREYFAVRKGILKFRGFVPKKIPVAGSNTLADEDFKPVFEQKGVDMRIGLDIANYAHNRSVQRILIVTNDTDCIPALKLARISGLQTILARLPNNKPHRELTAHADFIRAVTWP